MAAIQFVPLFALTFYTHTGRIIMFNVYYIGKLLFLLVIIIIMVGERMEYK